MELLKQLSQASGPSGSEQAASNLIVEMLENYTNAISVDATGNVFAVIQEPKEGQKHLLFQAHMDEVGLVVTSIEENGFLHVANCGGLDVRILPAMEVMIHGKEELPGVISSVPPHLQDFAKTGAKIEDVFVDTGLSKEEVEKKVSLGDSITFVAPPALLHGSRMTGKAMDNRAGVASVLLSLEQLREKKLSCGLSVLFAVQEEVGCRGAGLGVYDQGIDEAVCVDVSFGASCDLSSPRYGELGKGPMIGFSPILDHDMSNALIRLAVQHDIPYQPEVMGGKTSTDADAVAAVQKGIRTALCSVPLRYMHTPVEVVDTEDVKYTSQLLAAYAISQKEGK